ncbi:hypothetical protein EPN87_00360 [archaeon]|nr:MAG: hypothetical protein EPN87_00360 [archaeon]
MISRKVMVLLFAAAGILMMGYLSVLHYTGGSSVCDINERFNCDAVNKSVYSEFMGIPFSIIGILYFAIVIGMALLGEKFYPYIFILSLVSLAPALYLDYIEFFVLNAVCIFCELSKVMIGAIIAVSFLESRRLGLLKVEF